MSTHFQKFEFAESAVTTENIGIQVEKTIKGHDFFVYRIAQFGSPYHRLVTASGDSHVRIWDTSEYFTETSAKIQCIHKIKFPSWIYYVLKLNKTVFLAICNSGLIRTFDITKISSSNEPLLPLASKRVPEHCTTGAILDKENHFVVGHPRLRSGEGMYASWLNIMKLETTKNGYEILELKRFIVGRFTTWGHLIQSNRFRHCFYVNTKHSIKLVNYDSEVIEKEFTGHEKSNSIRSICVFENSKREEILVASDSIKCFYLYKTSSPIFDLNMDISKWKEGPDAIHAPPIGNDKVYSSVCLRNQILCLCDKIGGLHVFRIEYSGQVGFGYNVRKIGKSNPHCKYIFHITENYVFKKDPTRLEVLTCSGDHEVKSVRLRGVRLEKHVDLAFQDFQERVSYLIDLREDEVASRFAMKNEQIKHFFVHISFDSGRVSMKNIFRTFLYL